MDDLISPEEIAALPDDPRTAFVEFEWILRKRITRIIDESDQNYDVSPLKERYVMLMEAAASEYKIEEIPIIEPHDYDDDTYGIVFRAAIRAATAQSFKNKRLRSVETVKLGEAAKARLKVHLGELRAALAVADIPDKRRRILEEKLAQFAAELEKEKSSAGKILAITAAFALITGAVDKAEDAIIKLPKTINAITILLGNAKAEEEEESPPPMLPRYIEPKALPSPPSSNLPASGGLSMASQTLTYRSPLDAVPDDDVPF